ncbi:MAG: hypothetical protein IKE81_12585, partial [Clostridia bacterium]|nr:hypothetical protein [Clostridia bacterium]
MFECQRRNPTVTASQTRFSHSLPAFFAAASEVSVLDVSFFALFALFFPDHPQGISGGGGMSGSGGSGGTGGMNGTGIGNLEASIASNMVRRFFIQFFA